MAYKLLYFDEVKQDVKEAKAWYREQQKGLEKRFTVSIKEAVLNLQKQPLACGFRYKNIRIAHLAIFPYSIHYYVDESIKTIVIIAIVHNSRHPGFTKKRL